MSRTTPSIVARRRDRVGTRYARRLRQTGQLPAVIYGHGAAPLAVSVDQKQLLTVLRQGTHVVKLDIEGEGGETCLVKDLQFGYLGDNLIHVDFTRVNLEERVTVHVHLDFVNTPASLGAGSLLTHDHSELTVTCRVDSIPDVIRVDLSKMDGNHLNAGEIELPPGMELAMDPGTCVASVTRVRTEATGEAATVVAEAAPEPAVIRERKEGKD